MTHKNPMPANAPQTGIYKHYKGNLYQVFGMTQHSETDEWMVVYQALYGEYGFWVRPLNIWLEPVVPNPTEPGHTALESTMLDPDLSHQATPNPDTRTSNAPAKSDSNNTGITASSGVKVRFQLVTPTDVSLTQLTKHSPG